VTASRDSEEEPMVIERKTAMKRGAIGEGSYTKIGVTTMKPNPAHSRNIRVPRELNVPISKTPACVCVEGGYLTQSSIIRDAYFRSPPPLRFLGVRRRHSHEADPAWDEK
jgi:hypothetical protein